MNSTTTTKTISSKAKRKAVPQSTKIVSTVTKANPEKKKKSAKKGPKKTLGVSESFRRHLLMPDVMGPFRIPREGGSVRTLLAMDRTVLTIIGDGTLQFKAFQMNTTFSGIGVGSTYSSVGSTVAFTGAAVIAAGSQYPALSSISDINFVAGCITVQYSGTPFSAKGEILLGRSISIVPSSTTYAGMAYYPGTARVQLAQYYDKPCRVSAQKISATANEFAGPTVGNSDVELPFVMFNSADPTISITIEVTRVFECRSTTVGAGVIPYDAEERSYASDIMAYQDAQQSIGSLLYGSLSPYVPEGLGSYGSGAISGIVGIGALGSSIYSALQAGRHRGNLNRQRNLANNLQGLFQ